MKRFHFDFVATAPRVLAVRRALAVLGLFALLSVMGYMHWVVSPETRKLAEQVESQAALQRTQAPRVTMAPQELASAWRQATLVSDQLNLPWSRIFSGLRKAAPKNDIAFLTIEPDTTKAQVLLSAESRDLEAMLKFYQAMVDGGDFYDVTLLSHAIDSGTAERQVRFRLSARWTAKP
jgi:Tfp pilus assembly protein FimT